jgi:hypothetical protein
MTDPENVAVGNVHVTLMPAPAEQLDEQVNALRPGDLVRVGIDPGNDLHPYVVESVVDARDDGALFVGPALVRFATGGAMSTVVSVKVLEPAAVPFYTNAPADRKPRIGDVMRLATGDTPYVFVGDGWIVGRPQFKGSASNKRTDSQVYDWDASDELALVDPAELEES